MMREPLASTCQHGEGEGEEKRAKTENSTSTDEEDLYNQYFSDESSFYGDDDFKAYYEDRCARFDPTHYWENVHPYSTQVLSAMSYEDADAPNQTKKEDKRSVGLAGMDRKKMEEEHLARLKRKRDNLDLDEGPLSPKSKQPIFSTPDPSSTVVSQPSSPPRNPYEGDPMAKQLTETLHDFLTPTSPSTTTLSQGPWIWIANPQIPTLPPLSVNQPRFTDEANSLLTVYQTRKAHLTSQHPADTAASITRKLQPERTRLADNLASLAQTCGLTAGKWMLFPPPADVDRVWALVAKATLDGRLGSAAKVATHAEDGKPDRLVCVYTRDFADVDDVRRVLGEMRKLGACWWWEWDREEAGIYYKTDAYTYLGIMSDNEFKLKASMYSSGEMLKERTD